MVVMTILMSVAFASCSSDKDDNESGDGHSIVGTWTMFMESSSSKSIVMEFKSDGTYFESDYNQSELFFEGKGLYVYSNNKLTINTQFDRELDNGKWTDWRKYDKTVVFDVVFNNNKLTLTRSDGKIMIFERK